MKILILILIAIFNFQSWAKADSIKDLDIEGFTIGTSLLNYFSKEEVLKNTNTDIGGRFYMVSYDHIQYRSSIN